MDVEKGEASICEDEKEAAVSSHDEVRRSQRSEVVIKVGFVGEMKREKKLVVDERANVDHEKTMS